MNTKNADVSYFSAFGFKSRWTWDVFSILFYELSKIYLPNWFYYCKGVFFFQSNLITKWNKNLFSNFYLNENSTFKATLRLNTNLNSVKIKYWYQNRPWDNKKIEKYVVN